ncbi:MULTISPECIES: cytochrome c biogenesis CcdA family protein [unclassified Nocardioides]|uniref:cytochrome c biogenesis CcdA family protein n=1 Tax=unclassified Nocardioides TaxID=2615069 RepID=UPI0009EFA42A|nr:MULTISPECIES: cytochrome c biogenesis CcdA family protein [unclassified Nocardioides]GAW49217.1 cytochrome c biogenesis protein, transmembrane region [Nocardioides sp. PD653-B2]GAW55705.1 cytochrome c biogenesis protein, transmembrane region [Nocardioides sp. PD653]
MDAGSIGLALGAGMLAAVNPCGFALLPAYLSLFVLDHQQLPRQVAVVRAVRATIALTTGFAAVFLVFGLAVAPVAASVQAYLPAFTVVLGIVVAVAGLWVALGWRLPTLRVGGRRSGGGKPPTASWTSMSGFGASYAVASLGCTIAPFLAVVVASFRSGSTAEGLVLFLVYAAGMGLVVGAAAVATALARGGLITRMRSLGGALPRIGGLVLLLAGAYVAWYGVWELRVLHAGAGTDPLVSAAESIQRWLADRVQRFGAVGFAVALGGLALFAYRRPRRHTSITPPTKPFTRDPQRVEEKS